MENNKLIRGLDFSESDNNINTQINIVNPYIQIVQQEEGLINDYNFRMSNLTREDALDRVKQLITLPNGNITIGMTAEYFDVPIKTIQKTIERNYNELACNGLVIIRGEILREYKEDFLTDIMSVQNKIPRNHLTLLTKRTVLNIAMLLRDSLVAKAVRYVILNVLETPEAQQLMIQEISNLRNEIENYKEEIKNIKSDIDNVKDTVRTSIASTKIIQNGLEDIYKYNTNNNYNSNDPNLIRAVDEIVSKRFDVARAYPYTLN